MKLVVYTVAIGTGFHLPDLEKYPDVDYICFTDEHPKNSDGWQVRRVNPVLPADLPRSSREYKIRPHVWLPEYEASLYIDTRVKLLGNPKTLWSYLVARNEEISMGFIEHTFRKSLIEEFEEVMKRKFDSELIIQNQLQDYTTHYPEILKKRPLWGGMIARRHNQASCVVAMEVWMANVLRYSRRDQLSLLVALEGVPSKNLQVSSLDILSSSFHKWPTGESLRPTGYTIHYLDKAVEQKVSNFRLERDVALADRDAIYNSTIWKLFAPYRKVIRLLRKN